MAWSTTFKSLKDLVKESHDLLNTMLQKIQYSKGQIAGGKDCQKISLCILG